MLTRMVAMPPSNAGALSAYAPPMQQQLHPLFLGGMGMGVMTPGGGGTGAPIQAGRFPGNISNAGAMADPHSFQAAIQAWRANGGQFPNFGGGAFDPRQTAPYFRQSMMDWRGPLRQGG